MDVGVSGDQGVRVSGCQVTRLPTVNISPDQNLDFPSLSPHFEDSGVSAKLNDLALYSALGRDDQG